MINSHDWCSPGSWVTWDEMDSGILYHRIGRIYELLQQRGSTAEAKNAVEYALIDRAIIGETHSLYQMPRITLCNDFVLVSAQVQFFTLL